MLKKISSYSFRKLKDHLSHASFLTTEEISSFYQLPALINLFLLPEIHSTNFSFIQKILPKNYSFLVNMNFPFV